MKSTPSDLLGRLLGRAARLDLPARLEEATATIQRALGSAPMPRAPRRPPDGDVPGGWVREAPPPFGRAPAAPTKAPLPAQGRAPTTPADAPAGAGTRGGRFLRATWTGASGSRDYKLYLPAGVPAASAPRPLVVMLHGCTQDPDDFAAGTRMNEAAERAGWIVLYPAQAPRSNASKCWNWFNPGDQRRGAGEPALLAALTRHIAATEPVDPDRIHVAGLSAGGAMAAILGTEYPDLYASVGVHSGLPPGAAHDVASAFAVMRNGLATPAPAGGVPVIVFHGDADATVHPGNAGHVVGSLREAAEEERERGREGRDYTRSVWRDRRGEVAAEAWQIHGGGHAWSGGSPAGSFADPAGPDATREMLRFFAEHPRGGR